MTSSVDRDRLRRDVGADSTILPDADADLLFVEAAELYTDTASIKAFTRILAIQGLMASSSKLTSYRENNSQENLSDVFKNLKVLLDYWEEELAEAVSVAALDAGGFAFFGTVKARRSCWPWSIP